MASSNRKKNKSKSNNTAEAPKREIKQVFVDDDGQEKTVEENTSAVEKPENDKNEAVIEKHKEEKKDEVKGFLEEKEEPFLEVHEEHNKKKRGFRIAMVIAAVLFSLLLSSFVGASLALWDTDKTYGDLRRAVFGGPVMTAEHTEVASAEASDAAKASETDEDTNEEAELAENLESEENLDANSLEENIEENTAGITEEISGVDSFVKAGTDDVITNNGDATTVVKYVDPNQYYPLPFTVVDESYFKDALFIGDSRMQGFGMWSGLPATYYTAVGFQIYKYDTAKVVQTEDGKVPIFDVMPFDAFSKVYIKVGLNELGMKESSFEEKYAEVIAKVREREPRAVIYVHGLLPVTAEKSATDATHSNANIIERNEALKEFAASQNAYYLDAFTTFAGTDGCLPAEMTSDGIHLKSQYMTIWKNFLMQNAVTLDF